MAIDLIRKGAFSKELDSSAREYTSSLAEDSRIAADDVQGSIAHVIMLCEQHILSPPEASAILLALLKVDSEIEKGALPIDANLEDIHPNIEAEVIRLAGAAGGKLHTGRSRNDQVATDLRMTARRELLLTQEALHLLIDALAKSALTHRHTLVPGFTHMQPAQATTWAHYLLSYAHPLLRHSQRLADAYSRINLSPLGAGPLAGSSLPLNRARTAQLLGFEGVLTNSLDSVTSRDYVLEMQSIDALICTDLSRVAADIIQLTTLGLLSLDDSFSYTSSAMPHKRDPYVAEMLRARCAKVAGLLSSSLSLLKGLPTGYNKDFQELKNFCWDSGDATRESISVTSRMLVGVRIDEEACLRFCSQRFVSAFELAELLVRKGIPFRLAHEIVGAASRAPAVTFAGLKKEIARVHGSPVVVTDADVRDALDPLAGVKRRGVVSELDVSLVLQSSNELSKQMQTRKAKLAAADALRAKTALALMGSGKGKKR